MTREEYLKKLKDNIQALTVEEQNEALEYYSDYFAEADDDEKVISVLGSPETLSKSIVEKFANAVVESEHHAKESEYTEKKYNNEAKAEADMRDGLFYSFDGKKISDVKLKLGAVEVVAISGKDKFCVETRGIAESALYCRLGTDGKLVVSNDRHLNFNFFNHNRKGRIVPRILITIPENAKYERFSVHIGAGSFIAKNVSVDANRACIEVGAGKVSFKKLNSCRSELRCGMGELEIDGKFTGITDVDCGMGAVKLNVSGSKDEYSYDAKIGLGDFRFNEDKKSGVCKIFDNEKKKNHFSVNCGMGSVSVKIN